ncbi:putative cytochrome p450 pisatin protein [Botrytis fragariae]|uniref:Putative cytochrome p450 pisatin protein n=1 Tax=Botrytis fragariae TaxID=1964551 RepID=A0A8H6EKT7_9HELO|nr:putative cytochrome p450 pisatin protein [Botrytis fragariae]KAF5875927.1 putative cytochrome p450 pisatin protein [Botrytis fragariae]
MLQEFISMPIWALIAIPVSIYVLSTVFLAIIDPLRHIPGPFLARFTRVWYCWEIYKGHFERTNKQLHTRYGPIVRIAPHEYSIDDVNAAKGIYSIGGGSFPKTAWYWAWQPPNLNAASLFSELDPHRHSVQRRKVANYYSMSSMVGYEGHVDNCSELLSRHFLESTISGDFVDMQHWLQCYAFDVIGEITFGQRFGLLDMGEDKDGVFKAIDNRGWYSTFIGIWSWLHAWLFPLLPSTGGMAYIVKFTADKIAEKEKVLKERRSGDRKEEGTPDFVTRILMASEKDPEKITRRDLSTTCQSNIGAGSDTTAITLSSVLYHLLKYPHTYQNLRDEIETAAKEGRISDPITFKEAQGLPYLQAVIKEGLRVHPAVGLGLQRIVPVEGTTVANQFIPGGSTVGINAYVAHQNTAVWGSDADQWRPERWLEIEEQGRGAEVEKYFFSFGMGSRTCVGKNISLLEMNKLIPQLVRRFDFELDADVERDGGIVCKNRWFVKQQNFRARVLRRRDGKIE